MTAILANMAAVGTATLAVTITGSNFDPGAVVRIKRAAAPPLDVTHEPTNVTSTKIDFGMDTADLPFADTLKVTVVNPPPSAASKELDFVVM